MKYRAILFDVDGTLLNTLEDLANSMNTVLAARGFPEHPVDAYRYFVGDGMEHLARRALPEYKRDSAIVADIVAAMRTEYGRRWTESTRPYYGVPKMLNWLEDHGVKKAILSNKLDEFTHKVIARFLPHWKFAVIRGATEEAPLKPDPTSARAIAEAMEIDPSDIAFLGDTATDMQTAVAAGMFPVGALWGFRTAEELKKAGARKLIKKPTELCSLAL